MILGNDNRIRQRKLKLVRNKAKFELIGMAESVKLTQSAVEAVEKEKLAKQAILDTIKTKLSTSNNLNYILYRQGQYTLIEGKEIEVSKLGSKVTKLVGELDKQVLDLDRALNRWKALDEAFVKARNGKYNQAINPSENIKRGREDAFKFQFFK